jgi:hypothetical protein
MKHKSDPPAEVRLRIVGMLGDVGSGRQHLARAMHRQYDYIEVSLREMAEEWALLRSGVVEHTLDQYKEPERTSALSYQRLKCPQAMVIHGTLHRAFVRIRQAILAKYARWSGGVRDVRIVIPDLLLFDEIVGFQQIPNELQLTLPGFEIQPVLSLWTVGNFNPRAIPRWHWKRLLPAHWNKKLHEREMLKARGLVNLHVPRVKNITEAYSWLKGVEARALVSKAMHQVVEVSV